MRVSVNIVTWNSMKYLPQALKSISTQTYHNFRVIVIDNGSNDGTVEFIRANYPEVILLRNVNNLGFSRAHNQGIELAITAWNQAKAPLNETFVLVMNPDIILESDFLEKIISAASKRESAAALGGKLLRAFEKKDSDIGEWWKSEIIDSTGLILDKCRRAYDRGANKLDDGKFNKIENVFGISGALCLYRASALQEAKYNNEYFDEDFFVYKEDVDLVWRLRNLGWDNVFVPDAVAYHYRSLKEAPDNRFLSLIINRRYRSKRANFYSYRNHLALSLKNDFTKNFLLHSPFIFFYEMQKFLYIMLFEPHLLKALPSFLLKLPTFLRKRKIFMAKAKIKPREMREWIK